MVKQLVRDYKCNNATLMEFLESACTLLQQFAKVAIFHIPWSDNEYANELA